MKKFMFFLLLSILGFNNLISQTQSNQDYYNNLYYTCKAWGYVKYFHSKFINNGGEWDKHLLIALNSLKSSTNSAEEFNNVLSDLLKNTGTMVQGTEELPEKSPELSYNLETSWFNDQQFNSENKNTLNDIKSKFRPQFNYYTQLSFDNFYFSDDEYYDNYIDELPPENYRLLALFRYWNIINYHFVYKNLLEEDWDNILKEFIPKIVECNTWEDYLIEFKKISSKLNDSQAKVYSELNAEDTYCFPFTVEYIEDQYVITGVFTARDEFQIGDKIIEINEKDMNEYNKDVLNIFSSSNETYSRKLECDNIIYGKNEQVPIILFNEHGIHHKTANRNIPLAEYQDEVSFGIIGYKNRPPWKIIPRLNKKYGYIDLGKLQINQIIYMFNYLWSCDALILDVRNVTNNTMPDLMPWLFDSPPTNASLKKLEDKYPGTYKWLQNRVSQGSYSTENRVGFENTWDKPLAILFDQETIGRSEFAIMTFEMHPQAIKIGSQTAGSIGNVSEIHLPGGLIANFSGTGIYYPDKTQLHQIGITPDYEVKPTRNGILDGIDEVLDFTLNHLYQVITNVELVSDDIPNSFKLNQNYPNPFNPATTINFNLNKSEKTKMFIFDVNGKLVNVLLEKHLDAGQYSVKWNGKNTRGISVSSGIYFCTLVSGDNQSTIKLNLIK